MASDGTDEIQITETWKVIDRWWTNEPLEWYWAALTIPGSDNSEFAICFNKNTEQWSFRKYHKDPDD